MPLTPGARLGVHDIVGLLGVISAASAGTAADEQIVVVLSWFDEIGQRVPVP